ncbi:MAG: UDP-N-acetylmuramoyl-tripeptide--D-alanyl-D-alanine ligase, partial [Myxococcales bacterium]
HHRRRFRFPIGGIGGSNGKTTTKEMIGAILAARGPALKTEGNLNNEIGVPLTIFRMEEGLTGAILEMGMNRPGELERISRVAEADCAAITNVGPEHLEHLGSIEGVARAEGEIYAGVKRDGVAVANADDALVLEQAQRSGLRLLTFGRAPGADVRLEQVLSHDLDGLRIRIGHAGRTHTCTLRFVGEHNAVNACAAFAMGVALGCSVEHCLQGLEAARPYKHRLVIHRHVQAPGLPRLTVIDDCYNANPASMDAALETLKALAGESRTVAVLGDMLEVGTTEEDEHRRLGREAVRAGVSALVAFGPRSRFTFEGASALGARAHHVPEPADAAAAVAFLKAQLQENDVVLVKGSRGMKLERVVDALTGATTAGAH